MLKVEIGYSDFYFPCVESITAYDFAKTAYDHIAKEDKEKTCIRISFVADKEKEDM